jgi:beta-galactosidase
MTKPPRATFTRRAVLRAGLIGTVVVGAGVLHRPRAARAAPVGVPSSPGAYPFNQDWLFGGVYVDGAEAPGYPEAGFTAVTLPHTVTPLSWGDWQHTVWEEVWVYRKHINGPASSRVFVDFEGVMTSATVFLNGIEIASHQGGYLPWSAELTARLAAGDNVLAVVVDARWLDVPPSGASGGAWTVDYLQPGGIYRDVALRVVPRVFIADVFARPANVLSASPSVQVQVAIDAAAVPRAPVSVTASLMDGATRLASATTSVTLTGTGTTTATLTITGVTGITLWSPDTPKLYQVQAAIVADGVPHIVTVKTGFREAKFLLDGFYLNGQRFEIFGLNRHQLFPYTGMAAPERLQRRDAELLKNELNCNMVRCSHYPQSPHFLDACDELGLMVWEEPPGWQHLPVGDAAFAQLVVQNVHDMVVRDRNRPSVIIWGTRLNETWNDVPLYAQTRQLAYALDDSRQTSGALTNQGIQGWAEDVFGYDDYHSSNGNAILEPPVPGVPYLVTEAVGALDGAPLYRWVDTEATLAIQGRMHAQVHNIAQSNPAYAGLLGWAGIDYASLSGGDRIWHNVKWPGVTDTFRVPKPGAAFYRSQVDPSVRPVILPVFFWDFGSGSPSGPGSDAMIATNCDRLEIYFGSQHVTGVPDTADYGSLDHPPVFVDLSAVDPASRPDLRVDGYVGAELVTTLQMSSDPSKDRLVLTIDDPIINGDGTDATRFTFRVLDAYQNQRPHVGSSDTVKLALTGPATLVADNPFPFGTYGGIGGGFIRSLPGASGPVTLSAIHPTLGQATGPLTVQPAPEPSPTAGIPGTLMPRAITPATGPPAPPASPPAHASAVSTHQIRAALAAILRPHGPRGRIGQLLRHSGYTVRFDAPEPGRLVIAWYHTRARHRLLVAHAALTLHRAGPVTVTIRLTFRGRSLLRHAHHLRLTAKARFTPVAGKTVRAARPITIAR